MTYSILVINSRLILAIASKNRDRAARAWGDAREALTQQLEVLGAQVKAKTREMESLKAESDDSDENVVPAKELFQIVKNWDRKFAKLTQAERKQFVRTFLGCIEVFPTQLRVRYNYDYDHAMTAASALSVADNRISRGGGPTAPAASLLFANGGQRASGLYTFKNGRGDGLFVRPRNPD